MNSSVAERPASRSRTRTEGGPVQRRSSYKQVRNARTSQQTKTNNIISELAYTSTKKRQDSSELVNSLLNIRARLEDYLSLVNKNQKRLDSRPRPKQLQPSAYTADESQSEQNCSKRGADFQGTFERAFGGAQLFNGYPPQGHHVNKQSNADIKELAQMPHPQPPSLQQIEQQDESKTEIENAARKTPTRADLNNKITGASSTKPGVINVDGRRICRNMKIKVNRRSPVRGSDAALEAGKENIQCRTVKVEKKIQEMSVDLGVFGTSHITKSPFMQTMEQQEERGKQSMTTTPQRRKSINVIKGTWARAGSAIAYFHKKPKPSAGVETLSRSAERKSRKKICDQSQTNFGGPTSSIPGVTHPSAIQTILKRVDKNRERQQSATQSQEELEAPVDTPAGPLCVKCETRMEVSKELENAQQQWQPFQIAFPSSSSAKKPASRQGLERENPYHQQAAAPFNAYDDRRSPCRPSLNGAPRPFRNEYTNQASSQSAKKQSRSRSRSKAQREMNDRLFQEAKEKDSRRQSLVIEASRLVRQSMQAKPKINKVSRELVRNMPEYYY